MRKAFPWLLLAAVSWGGYSYYRNHLSQPKVLAADHSQDATPQPSDAGAKPGAQGMGSPVTLVSPLQELMDKAVLPKTEEPAPPQKPSPSDFIAPSPVGTSIAIVHKTFAVTSPAKFPFEIPPHAANPQLHGTYRSFVKQSGVQSSRVESSDGDADVDLLLMNDQQYSDFLGGHPADTVYSVNASHAQDVRFGLPATFDRPMQYYLIFRNSSSGPGKKFVQADFRVDF